MATIYVSHLYSDSSIAEQIAKKLSAAGHSVSSRQQSFESGNKWVDMTKNRFGGSQIAVFLLTASAQKTSRLMSELGLAIAFQKQLDDFFVLPVVIGKILTPDALQDVQAIVLPKLDVDEISSQILRVVANYLAIFNAKKQEKEKLQQKIETNAAQYIEEALSSLSKKESKLQLYATIWYSLGFISLIIGIAAIVILTSTSLLLFENRQEQWPLFILITIKNLVIIGLLIASSKYSYTLAKSYMNEALKNSDRIHAISFGRFYLKAYGEKATWQELKEVFQHWNIAKDSSFAKLNPNDYDPHFVDSAVDFAKALVINSKK
jgi:DNA-binding MarR family transcriptional regulator